MSNDNKQNTDLKQGQFRVQVRIEDEKNPRYESMVASKLKQTELAEGWRLVLPRETKSTPKYNFNITLSYLPEHLWNRVKSGNHEYYDQVKDNIYTYNIKKTEHDRKVRDLYNYLMLSPVNMRFHFDKMKELYSDLYKNYVKGWVMLRAKQYLS